MDDESESDDDSEDDDEADEDDNDNELSSVSEDDSEDEDEDEDDSEEDESDELFENAVLRFTGCSNCTAFLGPTRSFGAENVSRSDAAMAGLVTSAPTVCVTAPAASAWSSTVTRGGSTRSCVGHLTAASLIATDAA